MFYICIFWTSASIFGAVYVFPFEKSCLVKERKADMYRLSVYYVCSTLCDMMAHVFYPTVFMIIIYFMADFKRTAPCFFSMLGAVLLIVITSQVKDEGFASLCFILTIPFSCWYFKVYIRSTLYLDVFKIWV